MNVDDARRMDKENAAYILRNAFWQYAGGPSINHLVYYTVGGNVMSLCGHYSFSVMEYQEHYELCTDCLAVKVELIGLVMMGE